MRRICVSTRRRRHSWNISYNKQEIWVRSYLFFAQSHRSTKPSHRSTKTRIQRRDAGEESKGRGAPWREREGSVLVRTAGATKSAIITPDRSITKPKPEPMLWEHLNRRFYCAKQRQRISCKEYPRRRHGQAAERFSPVPQHSCEITQTKTDRGCRSPGQNVRIGISIGIISRRACRSRRRGCRRWRRGRRAYFAARGRSIPRS